MLVISSGCIALFVNIFTISTHLISCHKLQDVWLVGFAWDQFHNSLPCVLPVAKYSWCHLPKHALLCFLKLENHGITDMNLASDDIHYWKIQQLVFYGNLGVAWTYLPLDKMADILTGDNFGCILLNENDRILIWISVKFVPRSPIGNKPALVQVMAWRRTGDKPLPETTLIQFTDAYMRHYGEMSQIN